MGMVWSTWLQVPMGIQVRVCPAVSDPLNLTLVQAHSTTVTKVTLHGPALAYSRNFTATLDRELSALPR